MGQNVYLNKCVIPILVSFIIKYHSIIFWPVMATCHYVKAVANYLKSKSINFITLVDNGPISHKADKFNDFGRFAKENIQRI